MYSNTLSKEGHIELEGRYLSNHIFGLEHSDGKIVSILEGGPADRCALQIGDQILAINQEKFSDHVHLQSALRFWNAEAYPCINLDVFKIENLNAILCKASVIINILIRTQLILSFTLYNYYF